MSAGGMPNIWLTSVEVVDGEWCLCALTDGRRRVISRHGTSREAAEAAAASMAASADRGATLAGGEAPDATRPDASGIDASSDSPQDP